MTVLSLPSAWFCCFFRQVSTLGATWRLIGVDDVVANVVAERLVVSLAGFCEFIKVLSQRLSEFPQLTCLAATQFMQLGNTDRIGPGVACIEAM